MVYLTIFPGSQSLIADGESILLAVVDFAVANRWVAARGGIDPCLPMIEDIAVNAV